MKPLTDELKFKLRQSHAGIGRVHWDMVYDTEDELVADLFHEKIYTDEDNVSIYAMCRGYEYIKGFRRYYKKHGTLTEKQISQLKRMAAEIAFRIYCK